MRYRYIVTLYTSCRYHLETLKFTVVDDPQSDGQDNQWHDDAETDAASETDDDHRDLDYENSLDLQQLYSLRNAKIKDLAVVDKCAGALEIRGQELVGCVVLLG